MRRRGTRAQSSSVGKNHGTNLVLSAPLLAELIAPQKKYTPSRTKDGVSRRLCLMISG
jgi:hypothetical protein